LQYRERKLEDAANLIENNLILLGATAVEDKLQDQVSCLKYQELSSGGDGHVTTTNIADCITTDMTITATIPVISTTAFHYCIQRSSVNSPIHQHSTLDTHITQRLPFIVQQTAVTQLHDKIRSTRMYSLPA
jgi:hypothetical protein